MSDKDITTILRGTVMEVGMLSSTDPQLPTGAFVRLVRNSGVDLVICGLTDEEARDIASSHFFKVASVTIQRSSK